MLKHNINTQLIKAQNNAFKQMDQVINKPFNDKSWDNLDKADAKVKRIFKKLGKLKLKTLKK